MENQKEFPLPPAYEPKNVEDRWYQEWEKSGLFKASADSTKPAFCIVAPPPNVTGSLHMGHSLTYTLQDLVTRFKRMRGFNTLWLPGTDHAGIATQNVVEKELKKEGKTRHDLGREAFVERVWEWKEKYGAIITRQLRKLGASCDWTRERFTMDEGASKAVQQVFITLFNEKLIQQDYYLINWCPRCQTALSDIEVEHKTTQGNFYHIRYPFVHDPSDGLEVATTRPETLLGDTAVAVHPEDDRYAGLDGKSVNLPLVNRRIPIIMDTYVDKEFGTGVVKITPAHDFNDFAVGNRHKLPRVNILNPDGTLNENAGDYKGLTVQDARKKIVEDLEAKGLLLKVEPHEHNVGHCYRCGTVVEPYYSKQWFMRMKPLAEEALKAVADGRTKFVPDHFRGEFEKWLNNIQDWCISRQIWWGHRIPVYTCGACLAQVAAAESPKACPNGHEGRLEQDPDVLDTWFSSGLWPFSTLGWPAKTKDLALFYPTSVMVTSWDILFFWVARMMMMGLKFMGEVPFREVYLHSLVADAEGKKMSKSKGNVVDPLNLIEQYGTDALRFTLTSIETKQRYVSLTPQKLESSRNFVNKLYNATRFVLMGLSDGTEVKALESEELSQLKLEDSWILTRLFQTVEEVTADYEKYRVAELSQTLYRFVWNEFCDWYLESIKYRLYAETNSAEKKLAASVVVTVLDGVLRLLHPVMPFVTEELWHKLPGRTESIMKASWPSPLDYIRNEQSVIDFGFLQEVVTAVRTSRSELNVPPSAMLKISTLGSRVEFMPGHPKTILFKNLCRVSEVNRIETGRPTKTAVAVVSGGELYLHLEGLIDIKAEAAKQQRERQKLEKYIQSIQGKLANEQFVKNAPEELVEGEKAKMTEAKEKIYRIDHNLKFLDN